MRIAVMQPAYLPWMGFFDLYDQVDAFVLLDDVQFEKQSWQQRNCIKGPEGKILLSIPIKRTGLDTLIAEARIDSKDAWQRKHRENILQCYAKAPHLEERKGWVMQLYGDPGESLCGFTSTIIRDLAGFLGITTPISFSSAIGAKGSKVERLLGICKAMGADTYLSPVGSFRYIDEDNRFHEHGITLEYQHFDHPVYRQLHGPFISHFSVIDLLLNEGPESITILRSGRRQPFSHEEMARQVDLS